MYTNTHTHYSSRWLSASFSSQITDAVRKLAFVICVSERLSIAYYAQIRGRQWYKTTGPHRVVYTCSAAEGNAWSQRHNCRLGAEVDEHRNNTNNINNNNNSNDNNIIIPGSVKVAVL